MNVPQLSPNPVLHFDDDNGVPASGYLLFTYAAGTTTKQVTFTDSSGDTQNTNPITLNSRGECVVYLSPSTKYKFVFAPPTDSDPPTHPIWTQDNISAFGNGGLTNFVIVDDYGVFPNTGTDSTAGFQDAIDALPAAGGEIYCFADDYTLVNPLNAGTKSIIWHRKKINGGYSGSSLPGFSIIPILGLLDHQDASSDPSYEYTLDDNNGVKYRSDTTAMSDTLPQAGPTTLPAGWHTTVVNTSTTASITITPDTSLIDDAATLVIPPLCSTTIYSNESNYRTTGVNVLRAPTASVGSAATTSLDAARGLTVSITGVATITAVTLADGGFKHCVAAGAFSVTTGASLIIPGMASGKTVTFAVGDTFDAYGEAVGVVRLANFKSSAPFQSAEIAIAGTAISTAHPFASIPSRVALIARCKTAEFNFAIGDEVVMTHHDDATNVISTWANATTIGASFTAVGAFTAANRTTGARVTLTPANWMLVLRAWS